MAAPLKLAALCGRIARVVQRPALPLAGGEGNWLPLPLLEPHSSQCREAATYALITLYLKMHTKAFVHQRSSIRPDL